jgi:uncharacterized protein (TIGR03435 family)
MRLAFRLTTGIFLACIVSAQPPAETKFDVVSVKPSSPDSHGIGLTGDAGRLTIRNTTIRFLIRLAYNLKDFQLPGGPPPVDSGRYDIDAVTASDASTPGRLTFLTIQANSQMRLRLQALLEDRFHLVVRHETKNLPAYYLTAAKNGSKLRASGVPRESQDMTIDRGHIKSNRMSMTQLAQVLSDLLGQPVRVKLRANGWSVFPAI